ncbi:MAG: PAS domain-containing protein [bacterium]
MQTERIGKARKQKRLMQTMIRTNKDLWDIKKRLEKNSKDLKYKLKQSEQELLREKKVSLALYENITSGLLIINRDHSIGYANPAAELITGYTREELLHADCFELLSYADCQGTGLLLPPPLKKNSQSKLKSQICGKNGKKIKVAMHIQAIIDENNRFSKGLILFNPEG